MSRRNDQLHALLNPKELDYKGLSELFRETVIGGMHGLSFSPYSENQQIGDYVTEEQIRRRMEIIRPYTNWVRSFSCTDGNEQIPAIAKEYGLNTLVGAWIGDDAAKNEAEINRLIQLAKAGLVDIAAVGNEVLYREEMSEDELIATINRVRKEITDVPVTYVDAYYEYENRPAITAACDIILANCYPFWEGCHAEYAILYMQDMYRRTVRAAQGKKVIISECGWPNKGQSYHGAVPSDEAAMRYFIETQKWSLEEDIPIFYFSSFDESWKVADEGDVGAYWGLWNDAEELKYQNHHS